MKNFTLVAGLSFVLTGCSTTCCRPHVDVPTTWREETSLQDSANVAWWEEFQDPVLSSYITEGLHNNRDLGAAMSRVSEFYALYLVSRSPLFPQVDFMAGASRQEASLETTPPLGPGVSRQFNDFNAFFNLSYELDLWGKFRSASMAALADYYGQVYVERGTVLTLVGNIASSYITLLQFDKQLEIAQKTIEDYQEALRIAEIRFQDGLTSELEVIQARSELESAQVEVLRLQREIPVQENFLNVLIGRNPDDIDRGLALEAMPQLPAVPAGLPSELLRNRPDIRQAEETLSAANFRITEARAAYFPQITLSGAFGVDSDSLENLFSNSARTWQIGATALQPIFNAGKTSAQVAAARARASEAVYGYESVVLNAFREVNDALVSHRISKEQLVLQKAKVDNAQRYLELASARYYNGETDYLSVLDARRNLFSSQLDLVTADANTFLTLINLYKALGGGWVSLAQDIACE